MHRVNLRIVGVRMISILLSVILVACMVLSTSVEANAASKQTMPPWGTKHVVAHAAGGIGGLAYTNSKQALNKSLKKGVKAIEIDFRYAKGKQSRINRLVCTHRFEWLGKVRTSLSKFLGNKINGKYSRMTARYALRKLSKKKAYLIMDTKAKNSARVYADLLRIVYTDDKIPDSYAKYIVPQFYKKSDYTACQNAYWKYYGKKSYTNAVKKVNERNAKREARAKAAGKDTYNKIALPKKSDYQYKFKYGILTMYKLHPIGTKAWTNYAKFCKKHDLVMTIDYRRLTKGRAKIFKKQGIIVAVHTIDKKSVWKKYKKRGAKIVYTNKLY